MPVRRTVRPHMHDMICVTQLFQPIKLLNYLEPKFYEKLYCVERVMSLVGNFNMNMIAQVLMVCLQLFEL